MEAEMNNPKLVDLNFGEIVNYDGQPRVMFRYDAANRPRCVGYCTSCEDKGLAQVGELDLMSHGCDSADFEALLGPLPVKREIAVPVLFLLEDPGGDYSNGDKVVFQDHAKRPPNNHYFWTLSNRTWPASIAEFGSNFYGPYFAYLMAKHGLSNVYITNAVKCGVTGNLKAKKRERRGRYERVATNCQELFLQRELQLFQPQVVFCFGGQAFNYYRKLAAARGYPAGRQLMHPSYLANRWQTTGFTQVELVEQNDQLIRSALSSI
jgi:hypothetical protein